MTENNGEYCVEPRSNDRPFVDEEVREAEALKNHKPKSYKLLGLNKVAVGAAAMVAGYLGTNALLPSTDNLNDLGIQDKNSIAMHEPEQTHGRELVLEISKSEGLEKDRLVLQKQIEDKYGIELLNQREGVERRGIIYDEKDKAQVGPNPVEKWSRSQLSAINNVLQYLPRSFLDIRDGKKFAIALMDYGTEHNRHAGLSYFWLNMISVNENAFNNPLDALQLVTHEIGHIKVEGSIKDRLFKIIGSDKSFVYGSYMQFVGKIATENPDIPQVVSTFRNYFFDDGGEVGANFAQTYIKGYERFMKAVGPVIDSSVFDASVPRRKLAVMYPKAQKIYDLYKKVFSGKEYDDFQSVLDPGFQYPDYSKNVIKTEDSKKKKG